MQTRTFLNLTLAIGAAFGVATPGLAKEQDAAATPRAPARSALSEIPDPELATMRGRFVIGNNTVAYFGVTMASSWTTVGGQELNGSVVLGMHFDPGDQTPVITFTPTMNIVQGTPLPAIHMDGGTRSVDGSGLANVNGLVQGVQVAGHGNRHLAVRFASVFRRRPRCRRFRSRQGRFAGPRRGRPRAGLAMDTQRQRWPAGAAHLGRPVRGQPAAARPRARRRRRIEPGVACSLAGALAIAPGRDRRLMPSVMRGQHPS